MPLPLAGSGRNVRSAPGAYALALGALAAALLARYLLIPWIGSSLPFITMFGAVAAAAWLGGYRPAVLVVVLGYFASGYLLVPGSDFGFNEIGGVVGLLAYLFTCALVVGFAEATRRAQIRDRERGELLRVTLRSIGDAVMTTGVDGRINSMNPVAESLTGWAEAEALGRPLETVLQIISERTRQPVDNPAIKALREGVFVGLANHTMLIGKDGREHQIDDSAAPIRDEQGHVSGSVMVFRDVSEQRRLERERADQLMSARLLASIIETSNDAIISKSLDGTIQSWNAAAERLFGYPAAAAVGRHISLVIPSERRAEEDAILESLSAGKRIEHYETERVRADGRRILVSLTISPIKNASGRVVGASKIVRDVTDRRRLEDNLRNLAADLAEADRRKNEFLAMLAHELRNPLAPISNAARALRLGGRDEQALRSASEMLERQVGQMARLVDDLLDMSRITRGKIELRKERVELAPIIQQAVEAVRAQYKRMNHELTIALPAQPVHLHADPARLAQVVGNLLNNACKFTDRGGRVSVTVESTGDEVAVRVRDNGIGIAPEHLPRLFDMFAQVDTSLERSRDGLGIGLTLVKTLVELHDGSVHAHSDGPGRGSEFTLRLAVAPAMPELAAGPSLAPTPAIARRVLIVDDNEDGAESLAMLLALVGHETHKAHDGRQAIEAAERLRPDAVLLDIGLPALNGYEVCRRIRQESWGRNLMMVALTGWGQDEDRHRSSEAGFDAHMVKPVNPDVLLKMLDALPVDPAAATAERRT